MGIPKFFRWISERYPACSQLVTENSVPPFDKLYLDMNGIIHHCSHGNGIGPKRPNAVVFAEILGYLELLVAKIKPKGVLYLAIDGVAPRAKMNQQRARRFRSVQEAKAQLARSGMARADSFDSNCITPGTEFMGELDAYLKSSLAEKVAKDPNWSSFTTIFSGSDVPGEGEHKIMHYIRTCKSQPDYDPNVRHCLYGLDADLILLGLLSHDPHFALLREEIKFASKRKASSGAAKFYLMHLGLLREYIGLEFSNLLCEYSLRPGDGFELGDGDPADAVDALRNGLEKIHISSKPQPESSQGPGKPLRDAPPGFSTERAIDDIILLMTLVGNDFLPHLPHLHIHDCAVAILWAAYKRVQAASYLATSRFRHVNEFGRVNFDALKDVLKELLLFEKDCYVKEGSLHFEIPTVPDRGRGMLCSLAAALEAATSPRDASWDAPSGLLASDRALLSNVASEAGLELFPASGGRTRLCLGESSSHSALREARNVVNAYINVADEVGGSDGFKQWKRYYHDRKIGTSVKTSNVIESYLCGIQWVMSYYYDGVCSWSWFFPYHYAPHLSDLYDYLDGNSFACPRFNIGEPFSPLDQLMSVLPPESASLIPTHSLRMLITSETSPLADFYPPTFRTDLNGKRNSWEAVVLIPFIDEGRLVETVRRCLPADYVPPEPGCDWEYPVGGGSAQPFVLPSLPSRLIRGLCEGVRETPGFPRLGYIPHVRPYLAKARVYLFPPLQPSSNHSLCLHVEQPEAASGRLQQFAYFGWPFVVEARMLYADDGFSKLHVTDNQAVRSELAVHARSLEKQRSHWYSRYAVSFAGDRLVYGHVFKSMQIMPDGSVHKTWTDALSSMPGSLVVPVSAVLEDKRFSERKSIVTEDAFTVSSYVLCPRSGRRGIIRGGLRADGRVCVRWMPHPFNAAKVCQRKDLWKASYVLAKELGVSAHLLARLSASLYVYKPGVDDEFEDIGFGIKFEAREKAALGYTRQSPQGVWEYSPAAVELLALFVAEFRAALRKIDHETRPVLEPSQIESFGQFFARHFPSRAHIKMVEAGEERLDAAAADALRFKKSMDSPSSSGEWTPAIGLVTGQIADLYSTAPKAVCLGQPVYVCDRLVFGCAGYVVATKRSSVEVKLEEPGPTGPHLTLQKTSIIPAQLLALALKRGNPLHAPAPQAGLSASTQSPLSCKTAQAKLAASRADAPDRPVRLQCSSNAKTITPQELFGMAPPSAAPKHQEPKGSLRPVIIRKKPAA